MPPLGEGQCRDSGGTSGSLWGRSGADISNPGYTHTHNTAVPGPHNGTDLTCLRLNAGILYFVNYTSYFIY